MIKLLPNKTIIGAFCRIAGYAKSLFGYVPIYEINRGTEVEITYVPDQDKPIYRQIKSKKEQSWIS